MNHQDQDRFIIWYFSTQDLFYSKKEKKQKTNKKQKQSIKTTTTTKQKEEIKVCIFSCRRKEKYY